MKFSNICTFGVKEKSDGLICQV